MGAAHPDEAVVARRGRAKDVLGSDVKPQVVPQVAGDEEGVDLVGEGADVHLVALAANRPEGVIEFLLNLAGFLVATTTYRNFFCRGDSICKSG